MGENLEIIIKVAVFIGVSLYMWSVSTSLETIALDLKRLAERSEEKRQP